MRVNVVSTMQQKLSSYSQETPLALRSSPSFPLLVDQQEKGAIEHFGIIRARLLAALEKSGARSLLISSPQAQDGKSFTSVNLAISLAQLQRLRILLIDGDLRLRGITRGLELEQGTGLSDFLLQSALFEECVRATTLSHLYVVSAGRDAGEFLPGILQNPRWPEFMQRGQQEFDVVIVDSVPISAPVADFELLLSACDAALMVVHVRKTRRDALEFATSRMQGKLVGVLVNNPELKSDSDYYGSYTGNNIKS